MSFQALCPGPCLPGRPLASCYTVLHTSLLPATPHPSRHGVLGSFESPLDPKPYLCVSPDVCITPSPLQPILAEVRGPSYSLLACFYGWAGEDRSQETRGWRSQPALRGRGDSRLSSESLVDVGTHHGGNSSPGLVCLLEKGVKRYKLPVIKCMS